MADIKPTGDIMRTKIRFLFAFLTFLFILGDLQMWRLKEVRPLSGAEVTLTDLLFIATIAALIMVFGKIHFRTRNNYRLKATPALVETRDFKFSPWRRPKDPQP